ncbi:hypothetical protein [Paraburkholderia sp.]|jgi:hypothetical protein|uniref:hypothetical protein n=1 Tax=Paraburkholderia sp. TaxID=1926495 RepID=UPI002F40E210
MAAPAAIPIPRLSLRQASPRYAAGERTLEYRPFADRFIARRGPAVQKTEPGGIERLIRGFTDETAT